MASASLRLGGLTVAAIFSSVVAIGRRTVELNGKDCRLRRTVPQPGPGTKFCEPVPSVAALIAYDAANQASLIDSC
jgi:hypothetical protein